MQIRIIFAAVAILLINALPQPAAAQDFINILTGDATGIYYPLGIALAKIFAKTIRDTRPAVQATAGSVENLNVLEGRRGDIAFTLGDSLTEAWKGNVDAGFPAPLTRLRGMAGIYSNYIQIVASKESGIRTLADLKEKRISVGAAKSGTELNTRAVVKAAGLSYADFARVEYLPFAESVDLMKSHQLDVTLQSAGLGVPSLRDLAEAIDTVVVPVPPGVVAKIGNPAYLPAVIPAGTYKGQDQDVPSIAITNFLVTQEDVKPDLVYAMLKAIYDNLDVLAAAQPAAKTIKLANALKGMPIPLHPGAEKFYREKGMLK